MAKRRPIASASPPADIDLNPRTDPPLDFPDKPLSEMTAGDYQTLGFLCGLEVHQQLATQRKLFCRCPSGQRSHRTDAEVLRHMRPTLSELGEYDGTALMEFKTKKNIVYRLARETVCTYEIDDTPPFEIDHVAVKYALEISKRFDLKLVSELEVMRKQYLDGSIPTGFQRTAMVGIGGAIPFRESELGSRELRIRQLTLEEDSCREVSDVGHNVVFLTDRLGTPLIETVSEPELYTPRDAAEGGRLIASVARATGRVLRGAGAARQDVNVSIAGSRRVEIKGVPSFRRIPRLVHHEAMRHLQLLRIRQTLLARGLTDAMLSIGGTEDAWAYPLALDARRFVRHVANGPVSEAMVRGDFVGAVRLPGFQDVLAHPIQPGQTFVHELSERVRVIACLTARPFMIASGVHDHALPGAVWNELSGALGAESGDAIVMLWGPQDDVDTGIREVLIRARDALIGVPSETRQAFRDDTTGFERILPGPQRMYPDTDTPPLPLPDAWIEAIDRLPIELPWDRADRYVALGLAPDLASQLARSPLADWFDALAPQTSVCAARLAHAIPKKVARYVNATGGAPDPARIRPLVRAVDGGQLRAEAFEVVLDQLLLDAHIDPPEVVTAYARAPNDDAALEQAVARSVKEWSTVRSRDPAARRRWVLGRLMPRFVGKHAPAEVEARFFRALEANA